MSQRCLSHRSSTVFLKDASKIRNNDFMKNQMTNDLIPYINENTYEKLNSKRDIDYQSGFDLLSDYLILCNNVFGDK